MSGTAANIRPITGSQYDLPEAPSYKRDASFWMSFIAICSSLMLFALELTSVSTALPRIVDDLQATDFVWIGASYVLASTAFLPMTGGLSEVVGRKPVMLSSVLVFAIGSAVCGAAKSSNVLIIGRTIQGTGGGSIVAVTEILLGDLVPLRDRGVFFGLIGLTWAIACAVGPVVGGSLASAGAWRWLFYLNLPICGIVLVLIFFFLRLKSPTMSLQEKLSRMDWIGNLIIVGSSTGCALALTWGGAQFRWASSQVLIPLCIGLAGLVFFLAYEELWASEPIVPFKLMSNRTSASGYLQCFLSAVVVLSALYFIPIYYQACKGSSALVSGLQTLGLACIAPAAVVGGIAVGVTHKYCPPLWLGWCLSIVGTSLLSSVTENTTSATAIGYSVVLGCGMGLVYALAQFPVQAPLPVTENARSMSLFAFLRAFASIWGITLGNAILQNELQRHLPASYLSTLPKGVNIAYAVIPSIGSMPEPLRSQIRSAFANGISLLWKVLAGISGAGLLVSLAMREVPMHTETDEHWDLSTEPALTITSKSEYLGGHTD